jgi:hypothetical protein
VNVGISRDTSEFAVESIRQWWKVSGKKHYPDARELLICADGGGSNGSRRRGWKFFLQELSNLLASATTTKKGLKVVARLDKREYKGEVKFSDEDMILRQIHQFIIAIYQPLFYLSL